MTREEARYSCGGLLAAMKSTDMSPNIRLDLMVDSLVALGLLKLEEPKSVEQKTHDALYNAPIGCYACAPTNFIIGSREAEEIINHLARAGLTIVEKQHGE